MKGLKKIPTLKDLQFAMAALQKPSPDINPSHLTLWSQWARFEPRLAETLVHTFATHWQKILAMELNVSNRTQAWPHSLCLLAQMSSLLIHPAQHAFYQYWFNAVIHGVKVPTDHVPELYFIGTFGLGSTSAQKQATHCLKPYVRWGYLGNEILINKAHSLNLSQVTWLDQDVRARILSDLIKHKRRFTTQDYRDAAQNLISIRQAQLDIQAHKRIRSVGRTKQRQLVKT